MTEALILDRFLPYRLATLAGAITHSMATVIERRFDIAMPEWRVIFALGGHTDSAALDVAKRSSLDKVAVSRAVGKLTAAGFVTRSCADHDRRRSVLNLTDRGRALLAQLEPLALQMEAALLNEIRPEDIDAFYRILGRLDSRSKDFTDGL